MVTFSVSELSRYLGATLSSAHGAARIRALASPNTAAAGDITFDVADWAGQRSAWQSDASAVVTDVVGSDNRGFIVSDVVQACSRITNWLPIRRDRDQPGRLQTARIDPSATIAPSATVAAGVSIGERTIIAAGAVLGEGVRIGAFSRIGPCSVIDGFAEIGNRVSIGAGCSIGEGGFAFVRDGESWLRVPCFGSVSIGDDTAILSQVVIHGGVFSDTRIGTGCALDSHVLIGHDSVVGRNTAIAGQAAIAGAARIGEACRIGGKVGIGEGVVIADRVTVTAMTMVSRSLAEAGRDYSSGWPAELSGVWWRQVGHIKKLVYRNRSE